MLMPYGFFFSHADECNAKAQDLIDIKKKKTRPSFINPNTNK